MKPETSNIHIEDYNYSLPDERIAKYPLEERDSSKLLIYKNEKIIDDTFTHLTDYLPEDSMMIFNNTKVIQARLHFNKITGAEIEIFCLEPHLPSDYQINFQQTHKCSWACLVGNLKKWKEGELIKEVIINGENILIKAKRIESHGESHIIEFEWNKGVSFSEILEIAGELPIPPYLNRETEEKDKQTYQTVYSKIDGSVAAPTAGLHFTPKIFESLKNKGIKTVEITLHVGAGTFKPVKSEQIADHVMHAELISVSKDAIQELLDYNGKVIAVGTTSVRTIESLYYIGQTLEYEKNPSSFKIRQWQPYENQENISVDKALSNIIEYLTRNNLSSIIAETQILIAPGYKYRIVDGIITNFHQPKSTLLLLVSAFVGDSQWKAIYTHAIDNKYRFLSYGDSSLLLHE